MKTVRFSCVRDMANFRLIRRYFLQPAHHRPLPNLTNSKPCLSHEEHQACADLQTHVWRVKCIMSTHQSNMHHDSTERGIELRTRVLGVPRNQYCRERTPLRGSLQHHPTVHRHFKAVDRRLCEVQHVWSFTSHTLQTPLRSLSWHAPASPEHTPPLPQKPAMRGWSQAAHPPLASW